MKPVNLNAKYTLHFTYGIKHGRGHLILLRHFSVVGFFLASSHLCAEIPPTRSFMLKRCSYNIKVMQWLMWLDAGVIPVSDLWQSM